MAKLVVKKGDPVMVISGENKGKTGQINKVDSDNGRVLIEGMNLVTKHVKPKKAQDKGGRIEQASPIDASNVMIVCHACNLPTRVSTKVEIENGKKKKIRVCKRCGASLEIPAAKSKAAVKKAVKKKAAKAKAEAPKTEQKEADKAAE